MASANPREPILQPKAARHSKPTHTELRIPGEVGTFESNKLTLFWLYARAADFKNLDSPVRRLDLGARPTSIGAVSKRDHRRGFLGCLPPLTGDRVAGCTRWSNNAAREGLVAPGSRGALEPNLPVALPLATGRLSPVPVAAARAHGAA